VQKRARARGARARGIGFFGAWSRVEFSRAFGFGFLPMANSSAFKRERERGRGEERRGEERREGEMDKKASLPLTGKRQIKRDTHIPQHAY
jgi:hypothetical protein